MGLFDRFFGPPSRDKFAAMLKRAIEKAGESSPINYDRESFTLQVKGEKENILNLANAYNEYCATRGEQRRRVVHNFVQTWFSTLKDVLEDYESAQPDILPGIRNRSLFEHTAMKMKVDGKDFSWPYRPLGEFLGIGLVYDLPSSMMQIQKHSLEEWKVTFEEVYEVACENLREVTKHVLKQEAPGVWSSPWRDNYDPSRMLLIDYIRHHPTVGDPVVMVPNRDTLLLTGSKDARGLAKLVELGEAAYEHPRPITGIAFRLDSDNEWVPFLPDRSHPGYNAYRLLQVKSIGLDYDEQKQVLDELHEKTGKDLFVASYSAIQSKDTGDIRSYCVWSEGVVAFLPRVDYLYFFQAEGDDDGKIVATARWEDAESVLGDRLKPVGIYPERYLVDGFPTQAELAKLAAE